MSLRTRFILLLALPAIAFGPRLSQAQWTHNGTLLCDAANGQLTPRIVSDDKGGAIVTWRDQRGGAFDVYAQHVLASGVVDPAWPANGTVVCDAANDQDFPEITSDGHGGAIVTWIDYRGTSGDIYAQHVLASGVVDPAWPANGRVLCDALQEQYRPRIISDGAGGAIVAWQDPRFGFLDIYAQHVRASGTVDPAWTANGTLVCGAASNQSEPTLVSDGAGGAIITWRDTRGADADIYAQRVLASGTVDPVWTVNGTPVSTATNGQDAPTIASDGAGGAIITWQDLRNGTDDDIYAHRVLASGVVDPAWTANGTLLSGATGHQLNPFAVADGVGGAIVVWQDARSVSFLDTYAMHVLPSGVVDPAWTPNGTAVSNAASDQFAPVVVADGAGGALVAWADYRNGSSDVYAQHLLPSGVDPAWTTDGTQVCNAANEQTLVAIVADAQGAIVAWADTRNGPNDIYALRVNFCGNGAVAAVTAPVGEHFAMRAPYPNPTHSSTAIRFDLPTEQRVSVDVYDVVGHRVRKLVEDRDLPAGSQNLVWDGTSDRGTPASAGVYFVRVMVGGASVARQVVYLR